MSCFPLNVCCFLFQCSTGWWQISEKWKNEREREKRQKSIVEIVVLKVLKSLFSKRAKKRTKVVKPQQRRCRIWNVFTCIHSPFIHYYLFSCGKYSFFLCSFVTKHPTDIWLLAFHMLWMVWLYTYIVAWRDIYPHVTSEVTSSLWHVFWLSLIQVFVERCNSNWPPK